MDAEGRRSQNERGNLFRKNAVEIWELDLPQIGDDDVLVVWYKNRISDIHRRRHNTGAATDH